MFDRDANQGQVRRDCTPDEMATGYPGYNSHRGQGSVEAELKEWSIELEERKEIQALLLGEAKRRGLDSGEANVD